MFYANDFCAIQNNWLVLSPMKVSCPLKVVHQIYRSPSTILYMYSSHAVYRLPLTGLSQRELLTSQKFTWPPPLFVFFCKYEVHKKNFMRVFHFHPLLIINANVLRTNVSKSKKKYLVNFLQLVSKYGNQMSSYVQCKDSTE